ncbi:hypothetical protein L249_2590 [Ophiocordyceps polyrhachis-furcata BCC 54312]|uniref:Vegetative cell wall protein gp1 n=1 Tax=Ophiocordyceps polyrhachis-furcata BCC 54312 TaxID=1330021 RepID=A0A367LRS5_9HYPO|nr:hypothetical protein L249_2590 [Ophiocordyceps polyrhachis-furcata BCC 54312]
MNYPSPRTPGTTPMHEWEYSRMPSATPTPSPRANWFDPSTPRRPATRAAAHHSRASSYQQPHSPWPYMESPRYNSYGTYCTVDVSVKDFSSSRRPPVWVSPPPSPCRGRASTPYAESDEDEFFEAMGRTYMLPAQHSRRRHGAWSTDRPDYQQSAAAYYADPACARAAQYYEPVRPQAHHHHHHHHHHHNQHPHHHQQQQQQHYRPPTSHARRGSTTVPQRSATVKPTTTHGPPPRPKPPAPSPTKATEADARRHKIPPGYSLKNWDAAEEPILLLGSVFDANSLGKWIYDWTVYHEGAAAPIADMAGELWLLLIQLSDHVKQAESKVGVVRSAENRETIQDFVDAGERLMDKLRGLLKACEAPMLKAARGKKQSSSLGKNSGVEFVETLFGRDRELAKTEKFMTSLRLFNLRFEANCSEILDKPTA